MAKFKATVIQITVWFGTNRKMRIRANESPDDPANTAVPFVRAGSGDDSDPTTVVLLETLTKCLNAYTSKKNIEIKVENGVIQPD